MKNIKMKCNKKKLLLLTLILIFQLSIGQEKNHLSFDPILPIFGTYQVHYEHLISPRFSAMLGIGIKTSSGVFNIPSIDSPTMKSGDLSFNGYKIIPEVRWYLSKNDDGLFGFYTGAYFMHRNYTMPLDILYTDSQNTTENLVLDTKIVSTILGVQIGYKIKIYKNLFADFIITGAGASFNKFKVIEKNPIPDGFYEDLSNEIRKHPLLENLNLNINPNDFNLNKKTNVILPNLRYAIKIGYSF